MTHQTSEAIQKCQSWSLRLLVAALLAMTRQRRTDHPPSAVPVARSEGPLTALVATRPPIRLGCGPQPGGRRSMKPTVAIMSPGDMGHPWRRCSRRGLRVITCLEGRSARTRALAAAAGIEDAGDDAPWCARRPISAVDPGAGAGAGAGRADRRARCAAAGRDAALRRLQRDRAADRAPGRRDRRGRGRALRRRRHHRPAAQARRARHALLCLGRPRRGVRAARRLRPRRAGRGRRARATPRRSRCATRR